ncbi:prepilin-type N-terminal cleavage/methylation domain-containing protein [Campylobacter sp. CCUG 57310]|uniref:prepilin-type N-terminal cleavage/methylation domain-containing protein n=1 Tax=Campylobacter sp. CCUG 57310 TaxID=2517362 RepID=UPI0015635396|nr:type II secretion system protein [Campylobacter sp. CCUG 57310]QKF92463.1 putative type II secretion system protein [Campylobacter sp. CCUG 57310]
MQRGFSLIELIVSIVVVGITLMSIPVLLSQTAANNNAAIIQESVMDAKTRMALVLKAPWGCFGNKADFDKFGNLRTPIFNQTGSDRNFNFYAANGIVSDRRRNINNVADLPGNCAGGQRLNDFAGSIIVNSAAGYNRDAIVNSTLNTTINPDPNTNMNDTANPNMKEIVITTTTNNTQSDGANHTIILRAYSANIGDSPTIETRVW